MVNLYRFILEPYKSPSSRYICPQCKSKSKTFCRYIDTETNNILNSLVGRCNRESNCGYHYTPKQYFTDNNIKSEFKKVTNNNYATLQKTVTKNTSFIDYKLFEASLNKYENNNFASYLIKLFGVEKTVELINKYCFGTSKYWNGATIFWQIDTNYKVRTGKIMLYNPETGNRVKQPFNHIRWVHKLIPQNDFVLEQCLFGQHLLNQSNHPIAIVESEKTAIIASAYLPQFTWMACGSLNNLKTERLQPLKDRKIVLFPDLNGFEKWNRKAIEMSNTIEISVSNLLERKTTNFEKEKGFDISDYLIQHNYLDFISK